MRNVPTSSASRLSAARFRLKARSICSIAWERAADRITSAPGGRRRWTPARIESPAGPSGMMRSIRLSRPRRSSSSCALATSVSRRLSNACRLSGSAGSRSPATVTDRRAPPTRRRRLAPGESPRARAVAAESRAAPGRAISAVSAAPGGPPDGRRDPRNGPSARGSAPGARTLAPALPARAPPRRPVTPRRRAPRGSRGLDQPAAVDREDPVRPADDLAAVGRHHERPTGAAGEVVEDVQHLAASLEVEVARRLVSEDQQRVVHQRPHDRDALLLAAGEAIGKALGPIREPDQFQEVAGSARAVLPRAGVEFERQPEVFLDGQRRDQVEELEDETDVTPAEERARPLGECRHRRAVDDHLARRGHVDPAEQVEEGRLARPAAPEQDRELAWPDDGVDVPENDVLHVTLPVDLRETPHLDERLHPVTSLALGLTPRAGGVVQALAQRPACTIVSLLPIWHPGVAPRGDETFRCP